MAELLDAFLAQVEGYFGQYATAEIREDVRKYLARRVCQTKAHLNATYEAMKEVQPIRFGPPDVATTRSAIERWEQDRGKQLAAPRRHDDFSTAQEVTQEEAAPPTPEEYEEVRGIIARAATTNPAAMALLRAIEYRDNGGRV